jgi:hypothetical protein
MIAAGLCLLALAACESTPSDEATDPAAPAEKADLAASSEAAPSKGPHPMTAMATKPGQSDPDEFLGFGPDRLLPALGAPDFVRRDGPAQIWQYRAKHCVLDLFLYGEGDASRVEHVELRERTPGESIELCFSRMRAKRRGKPSG